MKKEIIKHIPLRLMSEANIKDHHFVKSNRIKKQKQVIKLFINPIIVELPVRVTLTRVAPRKLDEHDNLRMAFKHVVDCIADHLIPGKKAGRADDDKRIEWVYDQKQGFPEQYNIELKIEEL